MPVKQCSEFGEVVSSNS